MHRLLIAVVLCSSGAGLAPKLSARPDDGSITVGIVGRTDPTSALTVFQGRRADTAQR